LKDKSFALYNKMVDAGVAREIARMHLPLNTYTYFYWKIDLHNLFHFLKLRCDSHAQYEIRQFANVLAGMVKYVAPLSFQAWYDYSFQAVNFTRLDRLLLQYILKKGWNIEDVFDVRHKDTIGVLHIKKYAKDIGMSDRELQEFHDKTQVPTEQSFDLDLSSAKEASYFEVVKQ